MKIYKHKKTGEKLTYKDGTVCQNGFCIETGLEPSSEYWEEIIEKDYEILSVMSTKYNNLLGEGHLNKINTPSRYTHRNNREKYAAWNIHSVRRLSDGEIFTIGDMVSATDNIFTGGLNYKDEISSRPSGRWANWYYRTSVDSFKFIDSKLCIIYKEDPKLKLELEFGQPVEYVKKLKNPLFTTEDGVDIIVGDTYYWVNTDFELMKEKINHEADAGAQETGHNVLWNFSTKEAAEEYILMNKPCLSINDVKQELINGCDRSTKTNGSRTLRLLVELVKSKL